MNFIFKGAEISLLSLFIVFSFCTKKAFSIPEEPSFLKYKQDEWVIEKLRSMTLEEKIAQLIFIPVYPEKGKENIALTIKLVKKLQPGGIVIMKGSPTATVNAINGLQAVSKTKMLTAIDAEWGLTMRTDSTMQFPFAQTLGAVSDSMLIYQMGVDLGNQMKLLGINMNFGPVVDINTNPENLAISIRSFGEDKYNVANHAWWITKGLQSSGIIAVAKHFPGHGSSENDSHNSLPLIKVSKTHLDTFETYPFKFLAERGICGIMTAHLRIPEIDLNSPASLSEKAINGYLKNEIGFKGLVITDALNMEGAQAGKENSVVKALIAGNDMVEFVSDPEAAILAVKKAINDGKLTLKEIDEKCNMVLALKRWAGLNNYKPADDNNLVNNLNSPMAEVNNRRLIKNALTVIKNHDILPVQGLDTLRIASVMIGANQITPFQQILDNYTVIDHFFLHEKATLQEWTAIGDKMKNYNLIIAGIMGINLFPNNNFGISETEIKAVNELAENNRTMFAVFGNVYVLKLFEKIGKSAAIIAAYQNTSLTQELASQLIFGAFEAKGKLPLTIDNLFMRETGFTTHSNQTLSYSIPEETGINSGLLNFYIDSLANLGLKHHAYPGCQVLIAKNGNVIFHKTYGFHKYENKEKVDKNDIYDWASVTKVTGPLPALMKLVDEKKLDVDQPLSNYWPSFKGSNKENIRISEFLTHQSGIPAWIPFWMMTADKKGNLKTEYFKPEPSDSFQTRVSEKLYLRNGFKQAIFDTIRNSMLGEKKYVYSCLSFYIYPEVISNLTGTDYQELQT